MAARRKLLLLPIFAALLGLLAPSAAASDFTVQVVEVSGPVDGRLVDFISGAIEDTDAYLVVLKIDATAVLDEKIDSLLDLVENPPVPLAVWVGPAPAIAQGGAAQLLLAAPIKGAAPDTSIGYLDPTVVGRSGGSVTDRFPEAPAELLDGRLVVTEPIPGVVDLVSPSIGQFIVGLDGTQVEVGGELVTLQTARTEIEDGVEVLQPRGHVVFEEPGLVTRTLRVTIRPEAAFLFLVMGLAMITFEFYAAGPGVAAAVGAVCLFMAAYGFAALPTNWWAVAAAVVGVLLYVLDFQRNALGPASVLGTGLLLFGGLTLIDGGRQLPILWWPVVLIVMGAALFFGFALTTVARSRFSTQTIGREHLIGTSGTAVTAFGPEGVVDLEGARWRAVARRAAGIQKGDRVEVVGVDGVVLDVDPAPSEDQKDLP